MSDLYEKNYHAQGKLLLTGEYFVLDGALALALPTRLGQHFRIEAGEAGQLHWRSLDADGQEWFWGVFQIPDLTLIASQDAEVAQRLQQILQQAFHLSALPLHILSGCSITTCLDFSRHWGLGSSSTLLSFVANLAQIDPYHLLDLTFGGSGYDLACAQAKGPILYQNRQANPVDFHPSFAEQLFLVYLGKKQNSREGIQRYRALGEKVKTRIATINQLTLNFVDCQSLVDFEKLIVEHETLVAKTLGLPRAQELYFPDFWGQVKSLGAWGGDFVLASSALEPTHTFDYFRAKGFLEVYGYQEICL
jgi:mevalonate kinase